MVQNREQLIHTETVISLHWETNNAPDRERDLFEQAGMLPPLLANLLSESKPQGEEVHEETPSTVRFVPEDEVFPAAFYLISPELTQEGVKEEMAEWIRYKLEEPLSRLPQASLEIQSPADSK